MIDSGSFVLPSLQPSELPSFSGATVQQLNSQAVTYIFQSELQRNPSNSEISQYGSVIQNNFLGYDKAGRAHYNYGPARVDISTLQETTNKIQSLFVSDLGDTASQDIVSATENDLGIGVTLATIQSAITSSHAEENAINSIYLSVDNRSADSSGLSSFEQSIKSGNSLQNVRSAIAYSQETQNNINDIYEALYGRPADSSGLSSVQNYLANGGSLQGERSIMANSTEAVNDIKGLYNTLFDRDADASGLSTAQNYLANGGSLQGERSIMANSTEETNHIDGLYNTLFNREADASGLSAAQNYLATGGSLQGERLIMVTSTEETNDINGLYNSVFNREVDASGLSGAQSYLAGGGSLQGERSIMAYSSESSTDLSSASQFILGRSASASDISGYQNQLANGTTQSQIMLRIVDSPEFQNIARNIYDTWGQVPPTDDQLNMAGQAMYNLYSAWTMVGSQTEDQLQVEAATYQVPAATGSFQNDVAILATSLDQAIALEASGLVAPLMIDPTGFREAQSTGGASAFEADTNQTLAQRARALLRSYDIGPCSDPEAFRDSRANVTPVANASIGNANSNPDYQQGIQWFSKNTSNASFWRKFQLQGLPYEAYVTQQLGSDYVQLQPNFKTFDQWSETQKIAVSDKTLDATGTFYTSDPERIAIKMLAYGMRMTMFIRYGGMNNNNFTQGNLSGYQLYLAVPAATNLPEWAEICEGKRAIEMYVNNYNLDTAQSKSLQITIHSVS